VNERKITITIPDEAMFYEALISYLEKHYEGGAAGIINDLLRLKEGAGQVQSQSTSIEVKVTNILHEIGIPANIKGYHYIREAIIMLVEDIDSCFMKKVYPAIAKKHNSEPSRIERGIRHAIDSVWKRGQLDLFTQIFGHTINTSKARPTNREFIAFIADKLRLEKKE